MGGCAVVYEVVFLVFLCARGVDMDLISFILC